VIDKQKNLSCSFCGKQQTQVKKLIAGPEVYICDDCVRLCSDILIEDNTKVVDGVPSCKQIMNFLDQYVIGQYESKMVMSVAVNNHYKRLNFPIIDDVEMDKANLLLLGSSGTGKCLAAGSMLKVRISQPLYESLRKDLNILEVNNLIETELAIDSIFSLITDTENHIFVSNQPYNQKAPIYLQDQNGIWSSVSALITKFDNIRELTWANETTTLCADSHLIRTSGTNCKLAVNFNVGDMITLADGQVTQCTMISSLSSGGVVYDLQIESNDHLYQSANGVVHHNTLMAHSIARVLDVPFTIADATSLTEAGYVGDDVETILARLLLAADGDVSKAERGIIFIDEIDKKAKKSEGPSISRDVSGEGVQQALLKIIEGTDARVSMQGNRKHPSSEMITISTKNILFILSGAFVGLTDIIAKRINQNNHSIGFNSKFKADFDNKEQQEKLLNLVEPEDLVKYGLIPELVGRVPIVTALEDLTEDQLVQVLIGPKNALIKQYTKLFKLEKVELVFDDDALRQIAKQAIIRKTGARGLRSVIEKKLIPIQFELSDLYESGVSKIRISRDVIQGLESPILIRNIDANAPDIAV
jgi:endopeptidase Clp ATP-binding regulatory subunit ClpX